ncbi:MAG: hypothetical protein DRP93_00485 [Candidatus Neomarinimicrobiota bacterium]|nr:MAG: hypothetical protein DRP93_00485 [Candidatus Neomarinimicrobiota bacterium]
MEHDPKYFGKFLYNFQDNWDRDHRGAHLIRGCFRVTKQRRSEDLRLNQKKDREGARVGRQLILIE